MLAISSAVTDLLMGKIPNLITVSSFMAGVIIRLVIEDVSLFQSLALMAAVFCILFPFWISGGIGAGDIKILLAAACLMEPSRFMKCFILSFVFSGAMASAVLVQREYCRRLGKNCRGNGKVRMGIPIGLAIIVSEVIF